MPKRKAHIYIGTSGWHYKHWAGTFYPEGTKDREQLGLYQQHFNTVEINNSFYKLPSAGTFKTWRESVPENFLFVVKASRFITHMKKLNVEEDSLDKFFLNVVELGDKLGPILFQLPPSWKVNTERLAQFLARLPQEYRYAFEFRNQTWYTEDVYNLLREYNCAFCIYELAGHLSPLEVTADYVYLRLHGPGDKYQGSYPTATLQGWARRCRKWMKEGRDVYVYFDNDQEGYAAFNAEKMLGMI